MEERRGNVIAAPVLLASVPSVSVGFSARSRHFSPFGGAKIGASATLIKKRKMQLFFFRVSAKLKDITAVILFI